MCYAQIIVHVNRKCNVVKDLFLPEFFLLFLLPFKKNGGETQLLVTYTKAWVDLSI